MQMSPREKRPLADDRREAPTLPHRGCLEVNERILSKGSSISTTAGGSAAPTSSPRVIHSSAGKQTPFDRSSTRQVTGAEQERKSQADLMCSRGESSVTCAALHGPHTLVPRSWRREVLEVPRPTQQDGAYRPLVRASSAFQNPNYAFARTPRLAHGDTAAPGGALATFGLIGVPLIVGASWFTSSTSFARWRTRHRPLPRMGDDLVDAFIVTLYHST